MTLRGPTEVGVVLVHKLTGGRAYGFFLACQPLRKTIRGLYASNWDKVTCPECLRQKRKGPRRKSPESP